MAGVTTVTVATALGEKQVTSTATLLNNEAHGVLAPVEDAALADTAEETASPMQSVSRKMLAGRKAAKERNSKVWNKLDNMNEHLAMKRSLQLRSLFGRFGSSKDLLEDKEPEFDDEPHEDSPVLEFPITEAQIVKMLDAFKEGHKLDIRYAWPLLKEAKEIFSKEEKLQECAVAMDGKITVVGDLHGQLEDLFSIFTINGLPCEKNHYLFNGDFVDRGTRGAEVLFALCALKVLMPDYVRLNRGNHESRQQNKIMGFEEEMARKYPGLNGKLLLRACHQLFDVLPLCALIQKRIFVVHGGLFPRDGVTLNHIRGIRRKRETPIHSSSFEDQIFESMMWSDPRPIHGRQLSARGAGVEFGQDVTHEFLRTNRVALMIRSHECVQEGFELLHSGRLITLFSASRYCGLQTNKGAFLTIGPDLQPEIQQYYAFSVSKTSFDREKLQKENEEKLETEAVNMIIERIIDNKPSLYWHYTREDTEKRGTVSKVQWADGLKLVLELDVPFLSYVERLTELEEDDSINYTKFLERYRVQVNGLNAVYWQDAIVDQICERLFVAMGAGDVQAAFDHFDVDGDGNIGYEEFVSTLKAFDIGLSDDQVFELMRGLDKDCDSIISVQEFASRFEPVFTRLNAEQDEEISKAIAGRKCSMIFTPYQDMQIVELITKLLKKYHTVDHAFRKLDHAGEGFLACDVLADKLIALGASFSKEDLVSLLGDIDTDHDGKISKAEFTRAFKVTDRRGSMGRLSMSRLSMKTSLEVLKNKLDVAKGTATATVTANSDLEESIVPRGMVPPETSHDYNGATSCEGRMMQDVGWQEGIIQSIANFMFQSRHQLAGAYRSFDFDGDGRVDRDDFRQGMQAMNQALSSPLTNEQIDTIMNVLDTDGDGILSYDDFLRGFSIVDTSKLSSPPQDGAPSPSTTTNEL